MDLNLFFKFTTKAMLPHCDDFSLKVGATPSEARKLIRGEYSGIELPVLFKLLKKKLPDILDVGYCSLHLISRRFKEILEKNNITGWKTFPIKIFDKKNKVEGYYGFSITGVCGPIEFKKSSIIEKEYSPNCPGGKFYKGLYIGIDTWDGSDFFIPDKYLDIIITKKTALILKKEKITNMDLEVLSEFEADIGSII